MAFTEHESKLVSLAGRKNWQEAHTFCEILATGSYMFDQ
jgi:hypothetical protein